MFPSATRRPGRALVALALPALCLTLAEYSLAAEPAPAPRTAGDPPAAARPAGAAMSAVELDRALMAEIKDRSELMKNLEYLSDVIGPRVTGTKALEKANNWAADKMKEYGLENVRLEPWEIPVGWERGTASMKIIEPETNRQLTVAAAGWTGSTKGKVTGPVVYLKARTKKDLEEYKGKLKNAVILTNPPLAVAPVTDLRYLNRDAPAPKTDEPKKDESKKGDLEEILAEQPPAKDQPKKDDPKKDETKKDEQPRRGGFGGGGFTPDMTEFLKAEGVACVVSDSPKPHGLVVTTGSWGGGGLFGGGKEPDPRETFERLQSNIPRVYMAHEHYSMLYRLANRPKPFEVKVEVEITNKLIPGPVTCYNTVGEVRGSEKPDEIVVVGAHLDSWDLASGTTDNGTGSCVTLEAARVIALMAKRGQGPKRTIRFVLFTGEEQGLHGSRKYVQRHEAELPKHSAAIVHDTGTGKVLGLALMGREKVKKVLDPELASLKEVGFVETTLRFAGGTDHLPFNSAGVPGFACQQEDDEYKLTHHTQTDTFDHAKEPKLLQGAQVVTVAAVRIANLPELLPREEVAPRKKDTPESKKDTLDPKKDEPKKDAKKD